MLQRGPHGTHNKGGAGREEDKVCTNFLPVGGMRPAALGEPVTHGPRVSPAPPAAFRGSRRQSTPYTVSPPAARALAADRRPPASGLSYCGRPRLLRPCVLGSSGPEVGRLAVKVSQIVSPAGAAPAARRALRFPPVPPSPSRPGGWRHMVPCRGVRGGSTPSHPHLGRTGGSACTLASGLHPPPAASSSSRPRRLGGSRLRSLPAQRLRHSIFHVTAYCKLPHHARLPSGHACGESLSLQPGVPRAHTALTTSARRVPRHGFRPGGPLLPRDGFEPNSHAVPRRDRGVPRAVPATPPTTPSTSRACTCSATGSRRTVSGLVPVALPCPAPSALNHVRWEASAVRHAGALT